MQHIGTKAGSSEDPDPFTGDQWSPLQNHSQPPTFGRPQREGQSPSPTF